MIREAAICFEGKIYSELRPGRHSDVIKRAIMSGARVQSDGTVYGFLTTDGRFVDRVQAAQIAIDSGQADRLSCPPKLYTEDLW